MQNLSFGYSPKKLLYKDVSMRLEQGIIYGLLGKNGAGKSTLLKNMIGLLFPLGGTIWINGFDPKKRQPAFLETIYFIPEEPYVPALSIEKYVQLFSAFYPRFDKAQFDQYLQDLDVHTSGKLNTLSFGQQKKFVIAFGLACNTQVLLLDEPTNGLDIPSKKRFRRLIAAAMNETRTIVISTHQTKDLENLIDQIIIVDEGRLLLNASVASISEKLQFKTIETRPQPDKVLYVEESLSGFAIVEENAASHGTKVNIEHLFNAVTDNPERIRQIFN